MIDFKNPLWLKFAPKRRLPVGGPEKILIQAIMRELGSKTKYKVIERRSFFSGITTRVDSTREYTFEEFLPADGYVRMRMKNFYANGRKEFDSEKKPFEVADLSFTVVYLYE